MSEQRTRSRVVVTGGSGKLGRACVAELADHGWDVINLDRRAPDQSLSPYVQVDLTDLGHTIEALSAVDARYRGVDAVVHLAAIPAPGITTDHATFANNLTVTHNVFSAARLANIKNIVWASSETVLGIPFETAPPYLPVDEQYAPRPEFTYALVKVLEEEMARQLCRWDSSLKMYGLRFSNVMEPADYAAFPGFDADPGLRRWNLWAYIDARDGAQAVRRALAHGGTGFEVFIIANADTVMSHSSSELAAEVFPGVRVRKQLEVNETLLSIEKARTVLGYEPAHSWRDQLASVTG